MTHAAVRRRVPVVVLGAGLAGMSAGLALGRRAIEHRIFEKASAPGGHVVTIEEGGYRFDRTGHLLHLKDDTLRALVLELLHGDALEVERRSVVWSHGVMTRYPFQANSLGLPPEVAYECVLGFVQAQASRSKPVPKSFEDYCHIHFGAGISRHFMLPYNSRLWGVSPQEITAEWCGRFVPLPTLEDVIAGAVGHARRDLGYNAHFLYPRLGIGELSAGLHRRLGHVELDKAPLGVDFRARRLVLPEGTVNYKVLINTAPLPVLCALLADPPDAIAHAARRLRHTSLYYLDLALDALCPADVHWVYVPEPKYPFYRVGCYSHFSTAMAPDGKDSLYVELASRAPPDLSRLMPEVETGLLEMGLLAKRGDIAFARVRKLDYAYVIFDHGYFDATQTVHSFLHEHGIVSTGRYGGWNYSSMEEALLFGQTAAAFAEEALKGRP
ncbi:MAG: NAD(P)-binding protein [Polyangiaceae bacterium]|nr:NAD(P)-binding protein [Polyangiaceae bacterium]